jgi:copper chaperone NosL
MTKTARGLMMLTLFSGCGGAPADGPPALHLGADICDGCGMTLDTERDAAAAELREDGERRMLRFDDVGCLARWEAKSAAAPDRRWVHDLTSAAWIDADAAFFIHAANLPTPMGSGLAAFASAAEADAAAGERGGERLSWEQIRDRARAGLEELR